eukprot:6147660-Amphidinium_carterae.2
MAPSQNHKTTTYYPPIMCLIGFSHEQHTDFGVQKSVSKDDFDSLRSSLDLCGVRVWVMGSSITGH